MRHAATAGTQSFDKMRDLTTGTLRSSALDEKPAAKPAASSPAAGELLVRARDAYSRKDLLGSVNAYRAYIDRNPEATDARGELGNVYFAAGARMTRPTCISKSRPGVSQAATSPARRPCWPRFAVATRPWRTNRDRRIAKANGDGK